MSVNIIIVGAKDSKDHTNVEQWNNPLQASTCDLMTIIKAYTNVQITCLDFLYPYSATFENIKYINEGYVVGDLNIVQKHSLNIIIEFCNLFDENWINHNGSTKSRYIPLQKYDYYNVVLLSCGCGWDKGFPIDCITYIIQNSLTTKFNPYSVDNLLYTISSIKSISPDNKSMMYPYISGLYQMMGTFMWRGCTQDDYESEHILRELFSLIGTPEVDEDISEVREFINGKKHWNNMLWATRKRLSTYVYSS
jgi:hypothetical protein